MYAVQRVATDENAADARHGQNAQRAGRRSRYRLRKQVVEPVFGQIKHARGFRQFLMRGLDQVRAEWAMICTAHNLLKLANATEQ
jgi:IS5 family transposase